MNLRLLIMAIIALGFVSCGSNGDEAGDGPSEEQLTEEIEANESAITELEEAAKNIDEAAADVDALLEEL